MPKKITQLPAASALDGTEKLEIVQGGTSKQTTAQAIANLASGGGGGGDTFSSNPTLVLPAGKSFGKYVNGDTPSWIGLTAVQAILDAIIAYINPSWNSFSVAGTGIANTVEVGVTMPTSATATWSNNANSGVVSTIDIKDVTGATTLVANTPNDGTQAITTVARQLNSDGATQVWKGTLHDTGAVTQDIDSNPFTVTARFKAFFDEVSAFPTNSAGVRALTQSQFISGATTIDLAIGTTGTKRVMCLPPGRTVTHVSDVNNLGNDITANYVLTTISVNDAGGTAHTYNVYEDSDASPYPSATIHRFTIN